jgi:Zn-dependent protease
MDDTQTDARSRERRAGIPLGRLFGVPVHLSPSWLLLAALVTLAYGQILGSVEEPLPQPAAYAIGFGFVVCLVISVLLHELGHALTSRRFGIGVRGITLEMLGGFTEMEREAPRPFVELVVSLAGPFVSLILGLASAAAAAVLPDGSIGDRFAVQLALSNIVVAIFNSLPGLPLDGGRALQAGVWAVTGNNNLARQIAGWAGRLLALATLVAAVYLYSQHILRGFFGLAFTILVAIFMWTGATQAIRQGEITAKLPDLDAGRLAHPIVAVTADTSLAEAERVANESDPQQTGKPVIGVVDPNGALIALITDVAAQAVPEHRRPWVAIGDVSKSLDPAHVLSGELRGTDLLQAIRPDPAGDYLVVSGEDVLGVLRGAEIIALLEPRGLVSRRNRT